MSIPIEIVRNLEQSGVLRTMSIDLSDEPEDRAMIIEVLRSKLYSDKILAPIREYACNAMDSHVEAGRPETPIKVTLPTQLFPEFKVRDYGMGLTPSEVESIYIKYGRSTKRGTNAQTGQLGLGCKSAFAYGDNFIVVSYKDGVKTTYNLTISGVCTIIAAEPMSDDDESGIEVIVPVNQEDVSEFQNKSLDFFKYWKVCPLLCGGESYRLDELREELAKKPLFSDDDWEVRPNDRGYYAQNTGFAVMGNVPYPLNFDIIINRIKTINQNEKDSVLYNFIRCNKTILRFNIGELDFSASRESLEYTEKTCVAVISKIRTILDTIFKILENKINTANSYWESLLIYNQIFGLDGDRLFAGDIHKLENYYKGKFQWNGIPITTGGFVGFSRWSIEHGYSDPDDKTSSAIHAGDFTPILTVFSLRRGKVKQCNEDNYTNNNKIPASTKIRIVIQDVEKNSLNKAAVRYVFFQHTPTDNPTKVYFLCFKNKAQQADFFKKMNFESVPVIYVSDIYNKVKDWIKQSRVNTGVSTGIRDPQQTRFFTPKNSLTYYSRNLNWDKKEVDIHEEEGYYVDYADERCYLNGNVSYNLESLSHHTHVLFEAIGETCDSVYAFTERTRNAKWFQTAVKDGQWTKLEDYLKDNLDVILHGKGSRVAKSAKYFKNHCENDNIGIVFAERILPLLKNKGGDMYKACVEISSDLFKMLDITKALEFFRLSEDLASSCDVDFKKLTNNVFKKYPMIKLLDYQSRIVSTERSVNIDKDWIKTVSDYVNMVDSQTTDKND